MLLDLLDVLTGLFAVVSAEPVGGASTCSKALMELYEVALWFASVCWEFAIAASYFKVAVVHGAHFDGLNANGHSLAFLLQR